MPSRRLDLRKSSADVASEGRSILMSIDLDALRVRVVTCLVDESHFGLSNSYGKIER